MTKRMLQESQTLKPVTVATKQPNENRRTKEGCKDEGGLSFTVWEEELHGRLDEAGAAVWQGNNYWW